MRIDIHARVAAKVRLKGQRLAREHDYTLPIPVVVREFTSQTAPVVLRYDAPKSESDAQRVLERRRVELRTDGEGNLYKALRSFNHESFETDAAWLQATSANGDQRFSNPFEAVAKLYYKSEGLYADAPIVATESDDIEQVTLAVQRRAEEIVLIDGKVWVAASEPLLAISFNRIHGSYHGVILESDSVDQRGSGVHYPFSGRFRLDQRELALGIYQPIAEWSDLKLDIPFIEVVDPDFLKRDIDRLVLEETAKLLRDRMAERLKESPRDVLVAYADLRDTLRSPGDSLATEGLLDVFKTAFQAAYGKESSETVCERCEEVVTRFDLLAAAKEDAASFAP